MRANGSKSNGVGTLLLSMAAIALAGMVGTIGLIHKAGELGPAVGDIIAFDPLDPINIHSRIAAIPADDDPSVACVLDVRTMHAGSGSLVIEAREPRGQFAYRVHWAGPRSSDDNADCGSSADLLVSIEDVATLATAAGGYGVPASKHAGWIGRAAAAQ